jgi:ubiquinone/menaquinone biosynthesis C-methylase UbiE
MQAARTNLLQDVLRIFFQLLYHQLAWTYDLVAWLVSVGQWNLWVESVMPFLTGERVLELGHGPGHLQLLASQNGVDMTGLDLSPQMGRIAQRRILKHGCQPALVCGTGVLLPFRNESFSTIVATFPAEYIVFPETLAQIYRTLQPGGRFVLLPMAWLSGTSPFHRIAAWLFRITGQSVEVDHPALEKGLSLILEAGFSVKTKTIQHTHSSVLIVKAEKPAS